MDITTGRSRAATILYHGQRELRQIPFRWSAEKHGSIIHRRVLILAPGEHKAVRARWRQRARHYLLARLLSA